MKKVAIVLMSFVGAFLSGCTDHLLPPEPKEVMAWRAGSSTNNDYGRDVFVDGLGNVYVTGSFTDAATFGTTTLTSSGSVDMFVAKYNSNGEIQWVKKAGGTGDDSGQSIAVDGSGNVYVTGSFSNSAAFETTTLTAAGSGDLFVAKYTSNGEIQWVKQAGGNRNDFGADIAIDGSGNVYVTGTSLSEGPVLFDTVSLTSTTTYGIVLVAKYNNAGTIQWVQQAGGEYGAWGQGIAADGSGNVFVTGFFTYSAAFGAITLTTGINVVGPTDVFIAKYSTNGEIQWAKKAGGIGYDSGESITVDGSGDLCVTGKFTETAFFGSIMLSGGNANVFVAKYNTNGDVQWVQSGGGGPAGMSRVTSDSNGNAYLTGSFTSAINFNGTILFGNGLFTTYVAKFSSVGELQWAKKPGGTGSTDGRGISVAANGDVYVTGHFSGTATFGTTTISSDGNLIDIFVAKFRN